MAETKTYREALREGMVHEMDNDESVVLMGEDIGVYGGTHLITDGLIDEYGPQEGHGHAHKRGRLHRGRHRDGDDGHEARRRDDDLELLVSGVGPDHPERRQGPLLLGRAGRGAARHPRSQRRRRPALGPAHPLPGEPLRPLPRPQGRLARHPERREGHDDHRHKGPEPRDLPRSRRPLRDEGRGRRRRQRRRVRQGPHSPRGLGRNPDSLRPSGEPVPEGGGHAGGRGRR